MRKMKDSGIEWIGEIPENWDTIRVKHLATEKDTLFLDGDWINSDVIVDEGIRYLTSGNVGEGVYKEQGKGYISEETFNKLNCLTVYPGDLMISRLNEPVGRCCIVPEGEKYYVVAVDNVILRPNHNFHKKYLLYCMNTTGYARAALMAASGTTMQRISRTSLGNMAVPVASYEEQFLIADYLDQKCAEIDAIIAAKEKTNELLKERRQSIIYEAVTKGLDPTVPMKDSGVEWIGEIPESWEPVRAKYFTTITNGSDPKTEGDIPVYGSGSDSFKTCGEFKEGPAVLLGRKGATLHIPHYVEGKYWNVDTAFDAITDESICLLKFYYYASKCFDYKLYISMTTLPGMTQTNYGNMYLPLPSIDMQTLIVEYIEKQCAELDALISANDKTIEKLKEYRQSVIYEAVTGKVEI